MGGVRLVLTSLTRVKSITVALLPVSGQIGCCHVEIRLL